jgi:hypothetical protein
MISTLTLTLNHQSITIKPSIMFDKFQHYVLARKAPRSNLSSTVAYPDQTNDYSQTSGLITSEYASYGSPVDHISPASFSIAFDTPINTNGSPVLSSTNTNVTANFTVEVNEPLIIDP